MQFRSARVSRAAVLAGVALLLPGISVPAQPTTSAPTSADSQFAAVLARDVNAYRQSRKLRPLAIDAKLDGIAHAHSVAMAAAGKMSHDDFPRRVHATGFAMCVENVGWNYPTPSDQLDAWRSSPGHDSNLRDARVTYTGVGVAGDYVTWIACR